MNVYELSRYIIRRYNSNMHEITNLKLQKILYYIQGYFFKLKSKPAFNEEIYSWPYGPVVKEIYFEYSGNGADSISLSDGDMSIQTDLNDVNKLDKKLINQIINKSYAYSAFDLVKKTHTEIPWISTQKGNVISKQKVEDYFSEHDPLDLDN